MAEDRVTLLDTCAVVSLYASRRISEIFFVVGGPVAIAETVARESQFVFRGGEGDDARERDPVDILPLVTSGLVSLWSTDVEEELLTFIDLTLVLHEGEAMTAAFAIHRGCIVVTDDRKAIRVLNERGVTCRSTLDLIKTWAEKKKIPNPELRSILMDVRTRASYEPSRGHPLREWWDSVTQSA